MWHICMVIMKHTDDIMQKAGTPTANFIATLSYSPQLTLLYYKHHVIARPC